MCIFPESKITPNKVGLLSQVLRAKSRAGPQKFMQVSRKTSSYPSDSNVFIPSRMKCAGCFTFCLYFYTLIRFLAFHPQPQWKLTWQRLLPLTCPVCWLLPWAGILGYRWLLVKRHVVNSLMGRDSGRKGGNLRENFWKHRASATSI